MQIYKLFYSNDDVKYASIFQPNFVEKNKQKYKIIYKNKIYNLQNISKIIGDKNEKLKIKLICYNHIPGYNNIFRYLPVNEYNDIKKFKKNMNMHRFIDYFIPSYEIQKLVYKIDNNKDKINIFGEKFVRNNGNKCYIIYKDKIISLRSYFLVKDISQEDKENKKFEIILLELGYISDRSYMFYNCNSLVEVNADINKYKIENNAKGEEHLFSDDINEDDNFYFNIINESTINKNESLEHLICYL